MRPSQSQSRRLACVPWARSACALPGSVARSRALWPTAVLALPSPRCPCRPRVPGAAVSLPRSAPGHPELSGGGKRAGEWTPRGPGSGRRSRGRPFSFGRNAAARGARGVTHTCVLSVRDSVRSGGFILERRGFRGLASGSTPPSFSVALSPAAGPWPARGRAAGQASAPGVHAAPVCTQVCQAAACSSLLFLCPAPPPPFPVHTLVP